MRTVQFEQEDLVTSEGGKSRVQDEPILAKISQDVMLK